ncbi:MAG: hypothetical protein AAF266_14670 [Planctomycetota bacterium]
MNITPDQAREALSAANDAASEVQRAVDHQTSRIVLVWAFVYFFAPLAMHVWPLWGLIPQQLLLLGAIGYSIYDGSRNSLVSGPNSRRIGSLWGVTFGFAWAWFLILDPAAFDDPASNGVVIAKQMWAFGVSLAMFVYTVMGIWIGRLYVVTGVLLTLLTVAGLLFLDQWYWMWCAVTGGGTLLAAGLLLRRRGTR